MFSKQIFALALLGISIFSSCSTNTDNTEPTPDPPSTGNPPVETNAPNATYPPAFTGQTRIGGIKTTTAIRTQLITSALVSPWGVAYLPDGKLLVTEKAGRMRIVSAAGVVGNALNGVPAVNSGGQGGLLGLCLDPSFSTNRTIYWVFSEVVTGGNVTSVAKGRLSDNESAIEGTTVIYRSNTPYSGTLHYGGRVIFDKTGNLIVSIGERSDVATRVQAQSATSSLGKVIRITAAGLPASGNPSFGTSGALPELYSMGHRNPQGLALHPVSGEIWQSEHGPRGGDEINRLRGGLNFGWPTLTYGIEYSGARVGAGIQQQSGMEQPSYYWDPVVSPSGMTFYTGSRVVEWQNNLFIGALSGMHIVRLRIENNRITGEERLLSGENQRFRDITQGANGALYAVTDGGRLYQIDKQ